MPSRFADAKSPPDDETAGMDTMNSFGPSNGNSFMHFVGIEQGMNSLSRLWKAVEKPKTFLPRPNTHLQHSTIYGKRNQVPKGTSTAQWVVTRQLANAAALLNPKGTSTAQPLPLALGHAELLFPGSFAPKAIGQNRKSPSFTRGFSCSGGDRAKRQRAPFQSIFTEITQDPVSAMCPLRNQRHANPLE